MKARIFLYLFLFALMYVIFQYANSKRYYKAKEKEITELEQKVDTLESQLDHSSPEKGSLEEKGFTLKTNRKAREYFENQGMEIDSIAAEIKQQIIGKNKPGEDNPLIPYSGTAEAVMHINRIKILNNRWIMAEFTDGTRWGEALIAYYLDEEDNLQFAIQDGVIYVPGKKPEKNGF